jgi:hypothetical protein
MQSFLLLSLHQLAFSCTLNSRNPQKPSLVGLDCSFVSLRVSSVLEPILYQFQVVAHTAAINPDPMNALNPFAIEPILFQRRTAQAQAFRSLTLIYKELHNSNP